MCAASTSFDRVTFLNSNTQFTSFPVLLPETYRQSSGTPAGLEDLCLANLPFASLINTLTKRSCRVLLSHPGEPDRFDFTPFSPIGIVTAVQGLRRQFSGRTDGNRTAIAARVFVLAILAHLYLVIG